MAKRKHTTLSLQEKCEIIKKLDGGDSVSNVARVHGVGRSTISDIKKKKELIMSHVSSSSDCGSERRKTLKSCQNPQVEAAVYTWFLRQRTRRVPLSGEIVCEKAKWFYSQITGKDDFQASSGWLDKFKKRHGIRQLASTNSYEPKEHIYADIDIEESYVDGGAESEEDVKPSIKLSPPDKSVTSPVAEALNRLHYSLPDHQQQPDTKRSRLDSKQRPIQKTAWQEDEHDAFSRYIALSLKRLPPQLAVQCQTEIQSTLARYQLMCVGLPTHHIVHHVTPNDVHAAE